jgi:hypothetical protein
MREPQMEKSEFRIDHLVFGISAGAIASYMLFSFPIIGNESMFMLIIFNFLFVSLIFPLNGTLTRKLLMLLGGNVIGLIWNYLFSMLIATAAAYFGSFFDSLYLILNPFVNLIWIVSFWSMSLTILTNLKEERMLGLDN